MTNLPKFQRKLVHLISPRSFKLFSEHSCQVVDHRAPKLPRTENSFNSLFFSKKSYLNILTSQLQSQIGLVCSTLAIFSQKNAITFDLTKIERKKYIFH